MDRCLAVFHAHSIVCASRRSVCSRSLSEIVGLAVRFGISDGAGGQRETVGSAYRGVVPIRYGWNFQVQRRLGAERASGLPSGGFPGFPRSGTTSAGWLSDTRVSTPTGRCPGRAD
jgi:hypothetical protein